MPSHLWGGVFLVLVAFVATRPAEPPPPPPADDGPFAPVRAGRGAEDRPRRGADGGVTLGVLDHGPAAARHAAVARGRRGAARATAAARAGRAPVIRSRRAARGGRARRRAAERRWIGPIAVQ